MAEPNVPALQISASADMRQQAPIRLGMVGGGLGAFIGGVHRAAARLDNRYELVAGVFSEEPQEAAMSARLLHIPEDRAYETYQQMAEREANRSDRVDIVTIVTPNYLHFPIAKAFVELGFNLICDKPLATTVQEARELAEIARQKDIVFCVTHNYTGYPMVREARALVASGELGAIRTVRATYSQQWVNDSPGENGKPASSLAPGPVKRWSRRLYRRYWFSCVQPGGLRHWPRSRSSVRGDMHVRAGSPCR